MIFAELHFSSNVFFFSYGSVGIVRLGSKETCFTSSCGSLEDFSSTHSHLPITAFIPGMLFIPFLPPGSAIFNSSVTEAAVY